MTWFVVWSSLLFVLGLLLGAWWGVGHGERITMRALAERAEERRAARWLDRVRETRGGTVMPYRPPWPDSVASDWLIGYNRLRQGTAIDPPLIVQEDPESLAFWRDLDVQAGQDGPQWAGVAAGAQIPQPSLPPAPETDEEFTARMAGLAAEISAAARLAPDPYDQLWTAQ